MKLSTKIFTVLALIAVVFYGLEITLNLMSGKMGIPVVAKTLLVVLFLSYCMRNLHQWIKITSTRPKQPTHS
ncbi:MAG: hypothetical protein V3T42_09515 [Nitrospirales bacterium]